MILLNGFYRDNDESRRGELLECLLRNAANDHIDEIHLFLEDLFDVTELSILHSSRASAKIRFIEHGRRLKYGELFAYANQQLIGRRVIVANADIFFDHTLARLDSYELPGRLLCLSRWDVQPDGSSIFFDHLASQDAWIFQPPIREFFSDFYLGVPACDNRLAWEADRAGLVISNPGRSIRAHHLHLSGVRRYDERQRYAGPTKALPAAFLGPPWLWFVVPCMGRLDDLRESAPSLLAQARSTYVLVDYSCPDGAGDWLREHYPSVDVVRVNERNCFRGAEARNRGAAAADDDGIVCFLDADMIAGPGFSEIILARLEEGCFLVPDGQGDGFDSTLVCSKRAFNEVGGFDEAFVDWGEECADLRTALKCNGLTERTFPASLLSHNGRHDEGGRSFRAIQDADLNKAIHAAYRRAKTAILNETGGNSISRETLRQVYRAIAHHQLNERADWSGAAIAFRESMGYTIARLHAGISSHNNEVRPFTAIPEPLAGLPFTQVVASAISPVEVEFLTAGRVYVLVGNDWEGYHLNRSWLSKTGFKEALPLVETRGGIGFEVWSLIGEAGEQFVLPTQVMLVADRLIKK